VVCEREKREARQLGRHATTHHTSRIIMHATPVIVEGVQEHAFCLLLREIVLVLVHDDTTSMYIERMCLESFTTAVLAEICCV